MMIRSGFGCVVMVDVNLYHTTTKVIYYDVPTRTVHRKRRRIFRLEVQGRGRHGWMWTTSFTPMTSPPHVPPSECHLPHLREQLWVQFEQRHRPQKRRSGRVLRREEEVEEVATDLGVGGDRLRHVSGELGLLDFTDRASNSLMKRDTGAGGGDSSPLIPDNHLADDDVHDRHSSKDRDRHMCFFFTDDPRVSPHNSRISLVFTLLLLLVGLVSLFTILNNLNAPYLCKKDGIVLHYPHVKESPSLWENPFSSTTSWKPCAERQDGVLPDLGQLMLQLLDLFKEQSDSPLCHHPFSLQQHECVYYKSQKGKDEPDFGHSLSDNISLRHEGPGCSSIGYGEAEELGPFFPQDSRQPKLKQVSTEEGEAKSRELNVMFIEANAKAGFNIKISPPTPL
ncbi:Protein PECTIC ARABINOGALACTAN SYNTHESIS-RELATED [Glycine soja]